MDRPFLPWIINEFEQTINLLSENEEKMNQQLNLAHLKYYDAPVETLHFIEQLKAKIHKLDPSDSKYNLLVKMAKFQIKIQRPTNEIEETIKTLKQLDAQLYSLENEIDLDEDGVQKLQRQNLNTSTMRKQLILQLQGYLIEQDKAQ